MRTLFVLLAGLLLAGSLQAQNAARYAAFRLEARSDYNEQATELLRTACRYILDNPLQKDDAERLAANTYLLRWMTGSPDYTFVLDGSSSKFTKVNQQLMGPFLAALTLYALDHPAEKADQKKLNLGAVRGTIAYCKAQGIKLKGDAKKWAEAEEKGRLEEVL
ncbi:MAG: hypothetical protein EOO12_07595 [Chitinophagaceae bacterium]|nr:MAG: hypothetical protein EOO12_07595 [Chitinophagaceae bacterium]